MGHSQLVDSLCFAGKAKRLVMCASCLSDSHATDQCPENVDIGAALCPGNRAQADRLLFRLIRSVDRRPNCVTCSMLRRVPAVLTTHASMPIVI